MPETFLDQFISDGFVVIENFLSESETDSLKEEIYKLINTMPEKSERAIFSTTGVQQSKDNYFINSSDKISYFFESDAIGPDGELLVDSKLSLNKIGHALHDKNPTFRKVTFDERVKETCFQLGYKEPAIVQSMYIFKNPGVGGEVIPHQDATYLYTDPLNVVGFWIALDNATLENGCLRFARGSHKSGVHRRWVRNPDKDAQEMIIYSGPAPHYQMSSFTPVPVKKGSCILIDSQVVHYSEANKSNLSRHAYTFHVIETSNTKYSEENWLQLPEGGNFLNVYKN